MSGIVNGQPVDAPFSNAAWLAKNGDDTTVGKVTLANPDAPNSGGTISNAQAELNALDAFTGKTANSGPATVPTYLANDGLTPNGSLRLRSDELSALMDSSTGHAHDGTAGGGAPIDSSDLINVPLRGYVFQGTDIIGATGGSTDVSSLLIGESPSTNSNTLGVVVNNPVNRVLLRYATGTSANDNILDSFGNAVYGRLTESSGVWTLTYYVLISDVETAYTLPGSTDVRWYYQKLYNPLSGAPTYSEFAVTPSDNSTADVVDASATQRGVVSTGTQSFAGNKTFTGDVNVNGSTTLGDSSSDTTTVRGTATLSDSSASFPFNFDDYSFRARG